MNLERLEKKQGILWYYELAFWLKLWKQSEEYGFLKGCPSQVLQQKLMDLERAFRYSKRKEGVMQYAFPRDRLFCRFFGLPPGEGCEQLQKA